MTKVHDPDETTQSWMDIAGDRLWNLRGYSRQGLDDALWGAVLDGASPNEAASRIEALFEDERLVEGHRRWGALALLDSMREAVARPRPSLLVGLVRTRPTRRQRVLLSLIDEESRTLRPKLPPQRARPRSGFDRPRPEERGEGPRPLAEAKIRHPKEQPDVWIARCGNPRRGGCDGVLGWFVDAEEAGPDAFARYPPDMRPTGRWVLRSRHGYGGDMQRGYIVLKERPVSRRPLPERFGNVGGRLDWAGYWDGFIGQLPQPPCSVVCPACGTQTAVGFPPANSGSL